MELLNKANQYFVSEKYSDALKAYTSAVPKLSEMDLFRTYFGRGRCYVALNQFNDAVNDFYECLSLKNDDVLSYYYLGLSLFRVAKQNENYKTAEESHKWLLKAAKSKNKEMRFEKDLNKAIKLIDTLKPKEQILKKNNEGQTKKGENNENLKNVQKEKNNDIDMKDNNKDTKDINKDNNNDNNNNDPKNQMPSFRDTWYQNNKEVFFTLYVKNLSEKEVNIEFNKNTMIIKLQLPDGREYIKNAELFGNIIPNLCKYSVNKFKINISLIKKEENLDWKSFEKQIEKSSIKSPWTTNKNWDEMEKEANKELESDKPEGDEALQSLFGKIYKDADDDQKRAMIKSFQTSNGTVLSTNWKDVKDKDYEGKDKVLPTGQDVRNYEF